MKAIDCWVNVQMGDMGTPDYLVEVADNYFKQGDDFFRNYSIEEMIDQMDELGIERCMLTTDLRSPSAHTMSFVEKHPDRFGLSVTVDPTGLMRAVRKLDEMARNHPLVLARITPFFFDVAPNDRVYYPIYSKCCELDLAISINTGIPGPPMPAECQNPIHLDRVCLDFPELKLVMAHGADPWWDVAMRLMLKYHNLYMMTSAYLPKYLPKELLHFMNTRGKNKIMWASDHPAIQMSRCLESAKALEGLREGVLDNYLYNNAKQLFWPS